MIDWASGGSRERRTKMLATHADRDPEWACSEQRLRTAPLSGLRSEWVLGLLDSGDGVPVWDKVERGNESLLTKRDNASTALMQAVIRRLDWVYELL